MIEFRGSLPAHVLLWIAWIAALLAGEASWVAAILLAPVIFFQVGAALAAAATVAFGVRAGLRQKPRVFLAALATGTVVLIAGFDAAWGASLFGPLHASDPYSKMSMRSQGCLGSATRVAGSVNLLPFTYV